MQIEILVTSDSENGFVISSNEVLHLIDESTMIIEVEVNSDDV